MILYRRLIKLLITERTGIYNIGGREFLSRLEFTNLIAGHFQLDKSLIESITTAEFESACTETIEVGIDNT